MDYKQVKILDHLLLYIFLVNKESNVMFSIFWWYAGCIEIIFSIHLWKKILYWSKTAILSLIQTTNMSLWSLLINSTFHYIANKVFAEQINIDENTEAGRE